MWALALSRVLTLGQCSLALGLVSVTPQIGKEWYLFFLNLPLGHFVMYYMPAASAMLSTMGLQKFLAPLPDTLRNTESPTASSALQPERGVSGPLCHSMYSMTSLAVIP